MWIEAEMSERMEHPEWHVPALLKRAVKAWGKAWIRFAVAVGEPAPPLTRRETWPRGR